MLELPMQCSNLMQKHDIFGYIIFPITWVIVLVAQLLCAIVVYISQIFSLAYQLKFCLLIPRTDGGPRQTNRDWETTQCLTLRTQSTLYILIVLCSLYTSSYPGLNILTYLHGFSAVFPQGKTLVAKNEI